MEALYPLIAGKEPSRLHSVTELYRELRSHGYRLPSEVEEKLYRLNKYYTVTRYPDAANGLPSESVDRYEAAEAVEVARRVLQVVKRSFEEAERKSPTRSHESG